MSNVKNIELLLSQIYMLNEHYEEIANISGENFNIFRILDLTSKELIHSKFIATLLEPTGEHGMGDTFIKYFCEILLSKCNIKIDYTNAKVNIEKTTTDGRIDIFIKTISNEVIIENKIYAGDQERQLSRYHDDYFNAILLYLTLDGHKPNDNSTENLILDKDFFCISYKEHILSWLEICIKEAVNNPFLREAINQYIILIKQLTGQARSKQMSAELKDIITNNEENVVAYLNIIDINKEAIFKYMIEKNVLPALIQIAKNYNLEVKETNRENILREEYGFKFYKQSNEAISIWFSFAANLRDLQYGIFDENENGKPWIEDLKPLKYSNWHWSNIDIFKKLCYKESEIIKEIDTTIFGVLSKFNEYLDNQIIS